MFNLSSLMHSAWRFVRKLHITISAALRLAWHNAKAAAAAKAAAGITGTTHSWAGWKAAGYEVVHGATAAYKVTTTDPTTKNGNRIVAYFTADQVQPIEV